MDDAAVPVEAEGVFVCVLGVAGDLPFVVEGEELGLGLSAATQFSPDLVLLDVMMPGMDGGTLAAEFRASETLRGVPIVFLTAAVKRDEVRAHAGSIGGLPFLAKPVDLAELTRCIRRHLPP